MASSVMMIRKLQSALNSKGMKIMYSTSQFYSEQEDRPVTVHHIKQAVYDPARGKYINFELFKSPSQIQIVLFLRDLWYTVNGKEVPQDNEAWNKIRNSSQKGEY